jgi:CheY-like chemotaxis protein
MTFAPAYSPDLTGIVVLIVDDNADSLDVLSLALERFGATVQTAANARDALAKALAMHPHAIVSDLSMPDEDGLWLVDQLKHRQHGGAIPTVALTAHRSRYNVFQTADVGFDAFLAKPVDPFYLGESIAKLVGR